jgi:hypothetical protein
VNVFSAVVGEGAVADVGVEAISAEAVVLEKGRGGRGMVVVWRESLGRLVAREDVGVMEEVGVAVIEVEEEVDVEVAIDVMIFDNGVGLCFGFVGVIGEVALRL